MQNSTKISNLNDCDTVVRDTADTFLDHHQKGMTELSQSELEHDEQLSSPSEASSNQNEISESRNDTSDGQTTDSTDEKGSTFALETEGHDPGSTSTMYQKLMAGCNDHWVWETSGCVLALACLTAIIIILALRQDLPIPDWPSAISINSLVSIFTAVMKAAIMLPVAEVNQLKWLWFENSRPLMDMEDFDSATRGPWGALLLLSSLRGNNLARFGTILVVGTLAIDPFSQQIIKYYSCFPVAHNAFAMIPRTNNYTGDGVSLRPGNAGVSEFVSTVITAGTLGAPVKERSLIPFICPSGNCTFPGSDGATFQTLGMCHACKEIGDLIRVNKTSPGFWLENWKGDPSWRWSNQPARVGYTFPNTSMPYSMFWSRKTLGLDPTFDDLITIDSLMLNVDSECNVAKSQDCQKHPWAVRCSIHPCIKTYSASIINAALKETVLSTIPLRKTNNSAIEITTSTNLTFSLATDKILRNGTWVQCRISDEPTGDASVLIGINKTLVLDNPNPGSPLRYYEPDCVWSLGYTIGLGLNQYMSQMFDNQWLLAPVENTLEAAGTAFSKAQYRNGTSTLGTTNDFFLGLTNTLTAVMRQHGDSGRGQWTTGNVLQLRTCVGVRWRWLSLPALIISLSIAFVAATALRSSRAGIWTGGWRSSAIAPILLGMNTDVGYIAGSRRRKSDLDRIAKDLRVRVFINEGRLADVLQSPASDRHTLTDKSEATREKV